MLNIKEKREFIDGLLTPVQFVKGVGPKLAGSFSRLGVSTVEDLLRYYPAWHVHKSLIVPAARALSKAPIFLKGRIVAVDEKRKPGRNIITVAVDDGTAVIAWIWFNRPYLRKEFKPGCLVLIKDSVELRYLGRQVVRQIIGKTGTYEFIDDPTNEMIEAGRIPVFYHSTKILTQELLRRITENALQRYGGFIVEHLPPEWLDKLNLWDYRKAVEKIHRPESLEDLAQARRRLAFDELFFLQLFLAMRKQLIMKKFKARTYNTEGELLGEFMRRLSFELTVAQKKVFEEIRSDLNKSTPMNRLLQGDVGSGKTVVALMTMLVAVDSGYQAAIMVPTEILAEQHYANFTSMLSTLPVKVVCLRSGMKSREKQEVLEGIKNNFVNIVVGTHALIQKEIEFANLGMVIIDERHKFGVLQRASLESKGNYPDCLMMTATPFPRALVLTLYGDTDLSIIDEMPPGRQKVATYWRGEKTRERLYEYIRQKVREGDQAYMVYPLVEMSDKLSLKDATRMAEHLQRDVFPELRVGLIHGRLKQEEKDRIMQEFKNGKIQILIATVVIESGIDVSNASIMVIEHAERFGLAQLHQLRGRIGRGTRKSYCYLMTGWNLTSEAMTRLKIIENSSDGFLIAEEDLKLRGPGDLAGIEQHGPINFGLVDLKNDIGILEMAREQAFGLLGIDPEIQKPGHRRIGEIMKKKFRENIEMVTIS